MPRSWQDYQDVAARLAPAICHNPLEHRMRLTVDALWERFGGRGVSWVGFYLDQPGQPEDVRMVLGPCRDKPACSPIGLHGACGQALRSGQTLIVRDVRDLGPNYIACDPRDQSEIVVPLVDSTGRAWAVLDVDSWEVGTFDQADDAGLRMVLAAAGLLG
jgi:putative methionine-R-sulfoxide reductase with GAF domain